MNYFLHFYFPKNFYFFEKEAEWLDRLDKYSSIVFAATTVVLTIFIFIRTSSREDKKEKKSQKIEFLKAIVLDKNSKYFFDFFHGVIVMIHSHRNNNLTDEDKGALIELFNEEHSKYRLAFYDLILPFDKQIYKDIKDLTDKMIDNLSTEIFNQTRNSFDIQYIDSLEKLVLDARSETMNILLKID